MERGNTILRPTWDNYFMDLAKLASTRATCPRLSVGVVLVKDKRVLATGYNGSPPDTPHCIDDGCFMPKGNCVRVIHAEVNALLQCDKFSRIDSTLYCTHQPCLPCSNIICGSGVSKVIYENPYSNSDTEFAAELFAMSGIEVQQLL